MLGPILFALYSSQIHSISLKHGVSDHFYADDEQIYVSFPLVPDNSAQSRAYSMVSNCVGETKAWMSDNLIQLTTQNPTLWSAILKPANLNHRTFLFCSVTRPFPRLTPFATLALPWTHISPCKSTSEKSAPYYFFCLETSYRLEYGKYTGYIRIIFRIANETLFLTTVNL